MNFKYIRKGLLNLSLFIFLVFLGIFSFYQYLKKSEFISLNLTVPGNNEKIISPRKGELLAEDNVIGRFHSLYDNLGIVSIRFFNQNRDSDDTLIFRIKEEGNEDWYYQAEYKTDQFQPHQQFPFGFPIIDNSANKIYVFELESIHGATGSGILVDYQKPVFIARSVFTKEELLKNKTRLSSFLINKFFNFVRDKDIRQNTIFFFLPLTIYVLYLFSNGFGYGFLSSLTIIFCLYDVFFLKNNFDFFILSTLLLWSLAVYRFRIDSRVSASFALGFLVLTPLLLVVKQDIIAGKSAVWAYLFLSVTVIRRLYEFKKEPKKLLSLKKFWLGLTNRWQDSLIFIYLVATGVIVVTVEIINDTHNHGHGTSANLTALVIRRYGKQTAETYMVTTKLAAYFILLVVKLLKMTYRYGPYMVTGLLILKMILNIQGFYKFYDNFYTDNQSTFFWNQTGKYLLITYLLSIIVFTFLQCKKSIRNKTNLLVVILIISLYLSKVVFEQTTQYKYDAVIWQILPQNVTEQWVDITIRGRNFKNLPFSGKVILNGVEHRVIRWTDREIIFRTDPYKTRSGKLSVKNMEGKMSNEVDFEYLSGR